MKKKQKKKKHELVSPLIRNDGTTFALSSIMYPNDKYEADNSKRVKWPAKIVIKNVYQDVNEIRGDLYFEVEKNKED